MNKYLLLRDNKQSGPYSVPELIEKGIKAYDLVWLDGKSVAWRYPSEIEELKAHAPTVEEQPFDRFYKRPAPTVQPVAVPQAEQHSPYEPKVTIHPTDPDLPPQKKVYINFPAKAAPVKKTVSENATPATAKKTIAVPEPAPEPVIAAEKASYSQPTEKITSYSIPSSKSAPGKNYVYYAAAACIILLGFIVVLFINNSHQKEQLKELNTIVKEIENKKASESAGVAQVKNTAPDQSSSQTSETIVNPELLSENDYNKPKTASQEPATSAAKSATASKNTDKPVTIAPGITYKERPILRRSDNQQQEAAPVADNGNAEAAPPASENIYKLVTVTPNSYKTGVLGGISHLQFELTNNSTRELYKVSIEIKYFGPEKKVVNKQTVYFENILPGGHSTIDVPKSKRGVSIDYTVTDIKS